MPRVRSLAPAFALALATAAIGIAQLPPADAEQELPTPRLPAATRGPVRIVFDPTGKQAFITESDEGTVAVVDAASGRILRRLETGGKQPEGIAYAPGKALLVANAFSGSIAAFDPTTWKRTALLSLRGEPADVVIARDGRRAFVSLAQLDEVAVLTLPELRVTHRIPVGDRPRPLALTPDGGTLLVGNFQGGDVSLIDTNTLRERRRVELTGVNLRGLSVSPDGRRAFVTGQIPANTRATREPLDIWTNTVFTFDVLQPPSPPGSAGPADVGAEGWIDFSLGSSPDPDGVVALKEDLVAVALAGSDQALLVRTPGPYKRSYDPVIVRRVAVGARPRGIAATPNGKEIWVANELDSTISVLDASDLRPLRRIELGIPNRRDVRLQGRYLFGNARLARGRQFTCASCHPGGNTDGLTWEFAHVPDGLPFRNTRNLRGGITLTGPFRWSGHEEQIEDFFQDEVVGLLQGPRQPHSALHALWNMMHDFPMPPNPYRTEDDRLTPAAERGKALFTGKAGCSDCHAGEYHGGTGIKAYVGTTREELPLDVPHLVGVHDSAPYLHDGRAATLEEIFEKHNPEQRHGKAHQLTRPELADLLRYVREL
jgi:DNA-binding beta-propeller fold protein YncE/mono/diheme cytochrome c family protein